MAPGCRLESADLETVRWAVLAGLEGCPGPGRNFVVLEQYLRLQLKKPLRIAWHALAQSQQSTGYAIPQTPKSSFSVLSRWLSARTSFSAQSIHRFITSNRSAFLSSKMALIGSGVFSTLYSPKSFCPS